MEFQWWSNHRL